MPMVECANVTVFGWSFQWVRCVILFARKNRAIKEREEEREMGPTTERTSQHNIINLKGVLNIMGSGPYPMSKFAKLTVFGLSFHLEETRAPFCAQEQSYSRMGGREKWGQPQIGHQKIAL